MVGSIGDKDGQLLSSFEEETGIVRADRLVAALLVLQSRGRVTAPELAEELEVSVKTARRDLEALAMAGFPVYSSTGRHGGWQLLGGARTDLSGLTATEATMLFLVAGPASTATPEAKQALRKLVQALPETFRAEAEAAAAATVLDPAGWGGAARLQPRLIWTTCGGRWSRVVRSRVDYRDRTGNQTTRVVHPLGVVKKGFTWYLVAGTDRGQRTFRVGRVGRWHCSTIPVVRPEGFDLAEAWRGIVDEVEAKRVEVQARLRVVRWSIRYLAGAFGTSIEVDEASATRTGVGRHGRGHGRGRLDRADWPGSWCRGPTTSTSSNPAELRAALVDIGAAFVARHGVPRTRIGRPGSVGSPCS